MFRQTLSILEDLNGKMKFYDKVGALLRRMMTPCSRKGCRRKLPHGEQAMLLQSRNREFKSRDFFIKDFQLGVVVVVARSFPQNGDMAEDHTSPDVGSDRTKRCRSEYGVCSRTEQITLEVS